MQAVGVNASSSMGRPRWDVMGPAGEILTLLQDATMVVRWSHRDCRREYGCPVAAQIIQIKVRWLLLGFGPARKCNLMTSRIAIHGQGIAACCCATLLREQQARIVPATRSRPRLPAVLISDGTQALLREIFHNEKLFEGLPRIRKRVVAWNGAKEETFPHSAVIVGEQAIGERLQAPVPASTSDRPDEAAWNIFTSKGSDELATEMRFGSRMAGVMEVRLRESAEKDACWAESVESGWLFLIATGDGKGSLICTGGESASLLQGSRLVCEQIETLNGEPGAPQFAAYPRTLSKLHGRDWIACGTAAMFFDPLSGEGTGAAVRQAILAAATARAVLRGHDTDQVLAEFSLRMRLGFLRHLEMCRTFYQVSSRVPFWSRELAMLDDGISWVRKEIGEQAPARYRLVDFDLVRL
jgi:hypothetical protein